MQKGIPPRERERVVHVAVASHGRRDVQLSTFGNPSKRQKFRVHYPVLIIIDTLTTPPSPRTAVEGGPFGRFRSLSTPLGRPPRNALATPTPGLLCFPSLIDTPLPRPAPNARRWTFPQRLINI